MKHIYFDQNITDKLCNNSDFSNQFLKNFKSPLTLIITPFSLIELSGETIKNCLKTNSTYNINFSDTLSNQMCKALDYYGNTIRGDIIPFLAKGLKNKRKYTETEHGKCILTEYENYLNSLKAIGEIPQTIAFDRVFALPLERFKKQDIYLHIMRNALSVLSENPHIPVLRLIIKSYKKLFSINDTQEEKKLTKYLKQIIDKTKLKTNKDLVDIEMIQFAIMGNKKHPVHFCTTDDSEQIKKRLHFLYMILKVLKPELQKSLKDGTYSSDTKNISLKKAKSLANMNFIFGKFSIVDNFGKIKEKFDVQSILNQNICCSDK